MSLWGRGREATPAKRATRRANKAVNFSALFVFATLSRAVLACQRLCQKHVSSHFLFPRPPETGTRPPIFRHDTSYLSMRLSRPISDAAPTFYSALPAFLPPGTPHFLFRLPLKNRPPPPTSYSNETSKSAQAIPYPALIYPFEGTAFAQKFVRPAATQARRGMYSTSVKYWRSYHRPFFGLLWLSMVPKDLTILL